MKLIDVLPDPEVMIQMQAEELGGIILELLNSRPLDNGMFHKTGISHELFEIHGKTYPLAYRGRVDEVLAEAFGWLESQGLVLQKPGQGLGWCFITRRGRAMKTRQDVAAYQHASLLPKSLLHSELTGQVLLSFMRGEYDVAVFQAFKAVEIAVRDAGGFDPVMVGTDLMRAAFHTEKGPLTDKTLPKAERESLAHFFAGAIGSYKNPQSHRTVVISDTAEAVEMVMLASHLLRIVDSCRPGRGHKAP